MNGLKYRFFIVLAMCLLTRIESRAGSAICAVPTGTMKRFQFVEPHMGTEFRIIVYGSEAVFVKVRRQRRFLGLRNWTISSVIIEVKVNYLDSVVVPEMGRLRSARRCLRRS